MIQSRARSNDIDKKLKKDFKYLWIFSSEYRLKGSKHILKEL
jgi:hypothetical protein